MGFNPVWGIACGNIAYSPVHTAYSPDYPVIYVTVIKFETLPCLSSTTLVCIQHFYSLLPISMPIIILK